MEWILPPTDTHPGFAVGDRVLLRGGRKATVITAEQHRKKICSIYNEDGSVEYIPVKYDNGGINGYAIEFVQLAYRYTIQGNELCMERNNG